MALTTWEVWAARRLVTTGKIRWIFIGYRVADLWQIRKYTKLGYLVRRMDDHCGGTIPLFPRLGASFADPEEWMDQVSLSVASRREPIRIDLV